MTDAEIVGEEPDDRKRRLPYRPVLSGFLGIYAPLMCIALQFSYFSDLASDVPGLAMLNTFPLFSYGVVALEVLILGTWLMRGDRMASGAGLLSGGLLAGSLFAGVLGLVLLPFSLMGLVVGIGALGLVPLFTSYVFFRNGMRAYHFARGRATSGTVHAWMLLGTLLVFGIPSAAQVQVSATIRRALSAIGNGKPNATSLLRRFPTIMYRDRLVQAYSTATDTTRQDRLARAYRELCGEDLQTRLWRLKD